MIKKINIVHTQLLLMCIVFFCSNSTFAGTTDRWQFILTPVLWNASVHARLADDNSGGDLPINPDYRFFTLDNLDDYMSLKFEANRGRSGILIDSLRARYQDTTSNNLINFIVATELGFIEISARYQLFREHKLDLIIGIRRSFLDIDQTRIRPVQPNTTTKYEFSWTDPLIGLRYHYPISDKWLMWFRGDVGGFNVATQRIINISTDMQYLINSHVSFIIGYRYLKIDFKQDDVLYDVSLDGMHLGVAIHF